MLHLRKTSHRPATLVVSRRALNRLVRKFPTRIKARFQPRLYVGPRKGENDL